MKTTIMLIATCLCSSLNAQVPDFKSEAVKVMTYQCGACHTSSSPLKEKGALSVFDLDNHLWVYRLTQKQKEEIINRLTFRTSLSDLELSYLMPKGYKPLPQRPTKKEIANVKAYLDNSQINSNLINEIIN